MEKIFNHIGAKKQDIADIVLLCGDPNRATIMAEKFLKEYRLVASLRGNRVYTGEYDGRRVTIMASFMGNPSMGIYSHELYTMYDVKHIIRLGTAGSVSEKINIKDIVVAQNCITDSNYNLMHENGDDTTLQSSKKLLDISLIVAKEKEIEVHICDIYSTDTFYMNELFFDKIAKTNASCIEMESGALYCNAKLQKREALTILTISDNIKKGGRMSGEEREQKTDNMFYLALEMTKNL